MNKTVQKNLALIGGLFFLAQSIMVPVASAAGFLADNRLSYWHAATSADPIVFNNHTSTDSATVKVAENANSNLTIAGILEMIEGAVTVDKTADNSEPTLQEVKDYVLGEIKKAGLSVGEANALINCESKWDYKAVNNKNRNGSNDKGLWQINSIHTNITDAEKLDYKASTKWAIAKRLADGNWSAWSCANRRVAAKPAAAAAVETPAWE